MNRNKLAVCCVVLFALLELGIWACAPPAGIQPLTPMPDGQNNEIGLSGHVSFAPEGERSFVGGGATLHYLHRFGGLEDSSPPTLRPSQPIALPTLAAGSDQTDTSCLIVLRAAEVVREQGRAQHECDPDGTCWLVVRVTVDVDERLLAAGFTEPGVLYSIVGQPWLSLFFPPEVERRGGFARFQVRLDKRTLAVDPNTVLNDLGSLDIVPFITSPEGGRLLDGNHGAARHRLHPDNGFAIQQPMRSMCLARAQDNASSTPPSAKPRASLGAFIDLGAEAHFGSTTFAGGGAMVRGGFEGEIFSLALALGGGYIWGALSLPMSVALGDSVWLYTEPSLAYSILPLRIPLGVVIRAADWMDVFVRMEYAMSFSEGGSGDFFFSGNELGPGVFRGGLGVLFHVGD